MRVFLLWKWKCKNLLVKRRNLIFYTHHRIWKLLLLIQRKFFWPFNSASKFCLLTLLYQVRKIYQVPEDEERHIQHIYYTPSQAFHLSCHTSNHPQISCFCASRQQGDYLFLHFISIIPSLTNFSFCFFFTNCCLLSQGSSTLLSKTLLRCLLNL